MVEEKEWKSFLGALAIGGTSEQRWKSFLDALVVAFPQLRGAITSQREVTPDCIVPCLRAHHFPLVETRGEVHRSSTEEEIDFVLTTLLQGRAAGDIWFLNNYLDGPGRSPIQIPAAQVRELAEALPASLLDGDDVYALCPQMRLLGILQHTGMVFLADGEASSSPAAP